MTTVKRWFTEWIARHGTALAIAEGYDAENTADPNWFVESQTRNAINHAHVSAEIAIIRGSNYAEHVGNLKEEYGSSSAADKYKDQYNNEVGREIAEWMANNGYHILNYTEAQLRDIIDDLVIDAHDNGYLIVDATTEDGNGVDLRITNQAAPNWTAPSIGWSGTAAARDYDHELPHTEESDVVLPADWAEAFDAPSNDPTASATELGALGWIGPGIDLGVWVPDVGNAFDDAEAAASPLVLDLSGGGVDLVALNATGSVYWNITNGNFANATGWVGSGSGLLCIDLNENGIIDDHSELFGTAMTDGFTVLSAYDSNSSNTITSADADWADLLVWTDDNSDGYSQAEELHTLNELLITSIDLNAAGVNYDIAGNHISHESTFTINGNTRDIVDAWFTYDVTNTRYVAEYELDPMVLFLPTLRGYGDLPDLHIAMSLDEVLLGMVLELAMADLTEAADPLFGFDARVADIMLRWAGADDINATSRGQYIDAQRLAFLEALMGRDWVDNWSGTDPGGAQAGFLVDAWFIALENIAGRLAAQTALGELFSAMPTYDPIADAVDDELELDLTAIESLSGNFDHSDAATSVEFWRTVLGTIDRIVGLSNLDGGVIDDLDNIIQNDDPHNIFSYADLVTLFGTTGHLTGDSNANLLIGGTDNNNISGYAGNDVLAGGADGQDTLYGGANNDTYIFSPGNGQFGFDVYTDSVIESLSEGSDTIRLTGGIDPHDVRMWTDYQGDLFIQYTTTDYVRVQASTTSNQTRIGEYVEQIVFDDETVWDLSGGLNLKNKDSGGTIYASAYGDTIEGSDVTDYLYGWGGNDTLTGADGYDGLYGGSGNDTYIFAFGDTSNDGLSYPDQVTESLSEGTDTIRFAAGVDPEDVRMWTDYQGYLYVQYSAEDMVLAYATTTNSQTRIGEYVEQIIFDDETTWDLTGGLHLKNKHSGGTVYASAYGDTVEGGDGADYLYGWGGNDILSGGADGDGLYGDVGDDTYLYSAGMDSITETSGADTLMITGGITINDIIVVNDSAYDTRVVLSSSVNEVFINSFRQSSNYEVETIKFDDGFYADLPSYNSWFNGTSGNDVVAGNDNANVLIGYAGNDDMDAGASNDQAHGGAGNDDIHGDGGDDVLHGGTGDDVLYGDDGADLLFGGAGTDTMTGGNANDRFAFRADSVFSNVDTISDFNISTQEDVLDISHILDSTDYQHGVDAVTDWVQITTSGSDSVVRVDVTGSATFGAGTEIVTLTGITGITDEAALVSSGNLLVA